MSATNSLTAADVLSRSYKAGRVHVQAPPQEEANSSGMAARLAPDIKLYQSPDLPYGGGPRRQMIYLQSRVNQSLFTSAAMNISKPQAHNEYVPRWQSCY